MINLFTTPPMPVPAADGTSGVVGAIREGARQSGADFAYLVSTAKQESALDPKAKAAASSATGLFQFIERTWLQTLKQSGPELGLGRFSNAISEPRPGHFEVSDPVLRDAILGLRRDPKISSLVAGALTRNNAATLSGLLGRKPGDDDLYAAHLLGATGAAELARLSTSAPNTEAQRLFPDAARTNPALFFDRATGEPKTVAAFRADLIHQQRVAAAAPLPAETFVGTADEEPVAPMVFADPNGPMLYQLFRTGGARAPMNAVVGALWSDDPTDRPTTPSYFPRQASMLGDPSSALPPLEGPPADVPLPPRRPVEYGPAATRTFEPLNLKAFAKVF